MSTTHLHKPTRQINGLSLYFSGEVAIIVIDRGENRLNLEFFRAFDTLLDDVERNASCKGVITTGVGKFYGNGLDLDWMATIQKEELAEFYKTLMTCLKRILTFPLPTLAAMNGHSFAGGALLAFVHDLRTMRIDKGWLCFNEVFINRAFSTFNQKFLRAKLGSGKNVSDALVLGRRYTAEEAFNCGLVHAIPSETLLISESIRVLKSYYGKTGYPRESLATMKAEVYKDALVAYEEEIQKIGNMQSKL